MPKPGQSKKHGIRAVETVEHELGWVLTEPARVSMYVGVESREICNDLIISIKQLGRAMGASMNLTRMTEEELLATKKLLDRAFELALPVVQRRDKEANDALDQGDDTYPRVYRAVPQLVYREGAVTEYRESLHGRLEDLSFGDGDGRGDSGDDGGPES